VACTRHQHVDHVLTLRHNLPVVGWFCSLRGTFGEVETGGGLLVAGLAGCQHRGLARDQAARRLLHPIFERVQYCRNPGAQLSPWSGRNVLAFQLGVMGQIGIIV